VYQSGPTPTAPHLLQTLSDDGFSSRIFDRITNSIAADGAVVTSTGGTYSAGTPRCCPDGMFTTRWAWREGSYQLTSTTASTSSTRAARTILPPATIAPVSDECTTALTNEADGNVVPLLCPGGGVNTLAWKHYSKGYVNTGPLTWSKTMALGRDVTATQVWEAMCSDYAAVYGTGSLTISAEHLAEAYHGWAFPSNDPVRSFELSGCPAH
jgi:hypothetical protein